MKKSDTHALEKIIEIKNIISIFKDIDEIGLKNILKNVHFKKFQLNEAIINEGEDGKTVYFLIKGACKVSLNSNTITYLRPDALFGEISTIRDGKRIATVKANEPDTTVISFEILEDDTADFKALYTLYKNISSQLSNKIENINKKLLAIGVS